LKREKGQIDERQRRTYDAYHKLILEAVRQIPSSTVAEITQRANQLKEQLHSEELPVGKLQPKIVRKHLARLREGEGLKMGSRYILTESLVGPSYDLNRKVEHSLRNDRFEELDFAFVSNVAGCYMITSPELSKGRGVVTGLWEREAIRFARGLFGLETLVTYALKQGHLSDKVQRKSGIDMVALREGLKRSLHDLDFFILSFAVDVPQLLSYLSTPSGEMLANRVLGGKWDAIMERAKVNGLPDDEKGLIASYSYE